MSPRSQAEETQFGLGNIPHDARARKVPASSSGSSSSRILSCHPWARRNDESDGVTSWKSGALWEGRLYIRIRLCAQSDGGSLIDSGSPTDHAERLVRPWGHLSVQRFFSLRSGDVSEPAWRMDTKPTRAKRGPKVSPCGADEAQPNKHSERRTRTTPKRALWRGPSASEVLPLVSYRASAGVVLRWSNARAGGHAACSTSTLGAR